MTKLLGPPGPSLRCLLLQISSPGDPKSPPARAIQPCLPRPASTQLDPAAALGPVLRPGLGTQTQTIYLQNTSPQPCPERQNCTSLCYQKMAASGCPGQPACKNTYPARLVTTRTGLPQSHFSLALFRRSPFSHLFHHLNPKLIDYCDLRHHATLWRLL